MSNKIGIFTVASKNYLAYVRTLFASVTEFHPEYEQFLCLADAVDGYFNPETEPYRIIYSNAIGIPSFKDMTLRYDIMEFNTAIKPYVFDWIFKNTDLDVIIYLDPDVHVYSKFEKLEEILETGASVVLTPHITQPLEDGKNPNDYHMLQSGVFNLGFIAVRRCKEALDFISWWSRRLATQAVADFSNNLFTDQRWCDLAPCFLPRLHILRNAGYNVAYWNMAHRQIRCNENGIWKVNGIPLSFLHFSGVSADKENVISKHQNRLNWSDISESQPLFNAYRQALVKNGWDETKNWPYAYGSLAHDFPIMPIIRRLYQKHHVKSSFEIPEDLITFVVDLCNASEDSIPALERVKITRLMYLIYQSRPDLQFAFNLSNNEGRNGFASWYVNAAGREYGLPIYVTQFNGITVTSDLETANINPYPPYVSKVMLPTQKFTKVYRALKKFELLFLRPIWHRLPNDLQKSTSVAWKKILAVSLNSNPLPGEMSVTGNGEVLSIGQNAEKDNLLRKSKIDFLDEPAEIRQLLRNQFVSNLIYMIWRSRADLQQVFDLLTDAGQSGLLNWYEASAEREYGLKPVIPTYCILSGKTRDPHIDSASSGNAKPGANLIGYANAELGMGEHVRMTAAALAETSITFGVINFDVGVSSRQNAILNHGSFISNSSYSANVFHINADQMLRAYCHLGRDFFIHRYNIGYWAWELAKCPTDWMPVLGMMDEVWAPSRFIQQCFSERTSIPVEYMPLCVTLPEVKPFTRRDFGLPENAFLFLYTFDFLSYVDRKNPFAAIRAFQLAFPNQQTGAALVLKIMNGDLSAPQWLRMMEIIAGDPRIVVINKTLNRDEVISLFSLSDCFVSLHRSEGFGRGPAEAMYLGKPVIVTNYSGNTDFTLPDNSCLVDFQLIPVEPGQYPFHEQQVWADPDIEQAAWFMKKVASDKSYSTDIGARARHFIHTNFSQQAIGSLYAARLRKIGLA